MGIFSREPQKEWSYLLPLFQKSIFFNHRGAAGHSDDLPARQHLIMGLNQERSFAINLMFQYY